MKQRADMRKAVLLEMVAALRAALHEMNDEEVLDLIFDHLDGRRHKQGNGKAVYPDLAMNTPIDYQGTEYDSVATLCDAYDIHPREGLINLRMGRPVAHRRRRGRRKDTPITVRGVDYPTMGKAADALGIARTTFYTWVRQGVLEERLKSGPQSNRAIAVRVNGLRYPSLNSAAQALGILETTFRHWYRAGILKEKLQEQGYEYND